MRKESSVSLRAGAAVALLTAGLLAGGCGGDSTAKAKGGNAEPPPVPVTVETVGRATVKRTLLLSGSIQPQSQVRLFTKVPGRIEKLSVDSCDEVRKDQVVARIDREVLAAGLRQAEAARTVAQVSLADAERDWKRAEKLFKDGVFNEQVLDKARLARELSASQLAQAEAAVAAAKAGLDETDIRATIDGTVTARFMDQGDFISSGQPLLTVQDLRTVKVLASVPQADVALISPGASRARVTVEGVAGSFEAVVAKLEPALDPATLSAPIELRVENRRRSADGASPPAGGTAAPADCADRWMLVSGMSARVELDIETHPNALVIPIEAVRNDGKRDFVFVTSDAGPKTTATRVDVKLGRMGAPRGELGWLVELLGPADLAGMRVVTEGVTRLTDGSRVQIIEKKPEPAGPAGRASAETGR